MKFTCEKNAFAREISFAQEVIASKNALSIMSNVLLEAEEGTLVLKATDIKVSFETRIPVETAEPGAITVFCDKLSGILASIPEGDIEVTEDNGKVVVKPTFKKVRFQIKTIASEKFPELPAAAEDIFFSIPAKILKDMIEQVVFAVSEDETRYFMNGVYFERADDGLVMVATDGRRLAYIHKQINTELPRFKSVIIPPKVLSLVMKRAPDEGLIAIAVTEKNIFFRFGSYLVSSVLIEGQFPNYQKVIPEHQQSSIMVKRSELIEALKRVSIFIDQKSNRAFFNLSGGTLLLSSDESELGTAREELPCRYDGPDVRLALNHKYIEEPLKAIQEESVLIEFTEPSRAITLSPDPKGDFFHIVMPMQAD